MSYYSGFHPAPSVLPKADQGGVFNRGSGGGYNPSNITALTPPVSGTPYQNTQGVPMMVFVQLGFLYLSNPGASLAISKDGSTWVTVDQIGLNTAGVTQDYLQAMVPANWYYKVTSVGSTVYIVSAYGLY